MLDLGTSQQHTSTVPANLRISAPLPQLMSIFGIYTGFERRQEHVLAATAVTDCLLYRCGAVQRYRQAHAWPSMAAACTATQIGVASVKCSHRCPLSMQLECGRAADDCHGPLACRHAWCSLAANSCWHTVAVLSLGARPVCRLLPAATMHPLPQACWRFDSHVPLCSQCVLALLQPVPDGAVLQPQGPPGAPAGVRHRRARVGRGVGR